MDNLITINKKGREMSQEKQDEACFSTISKIGRIYDACFV